MLKNWRFIFKVVFVVSVIGLCSIKGYCTLTLQNEHIVLHLEIDPNGIPYIAQAKWKSSNQVIFSAVGNTENAALKELILGDFSNAKKIATTKNTENAISLILSHSLTTSQFIITWNYELIKHNYILNAWVNIQNISGQKNIKSFPVFNANIFFAENANLEYFDALEYTSHKSGAKSSNIFLHSKVYSSDNRESDGNLPYWIITASDKIFFGLSWCGGWQASLKKSKNKVNVELHLPRDETQLTLNKDENIDGPKLSMTFTKGNDAILSKQQYDAYIQQYSFQLYDMPVLQNFPLVYNHWYAVRFKLNEDFLISQYNLLDKYGFDVFVTDAGWYDNITTWKPSLQKFMPGHFENLLDSIHRKKIITGIWSCPWLIDSTYASINHLIDTNSYHNEFMSGYAVNIDENYSEKLLQHIKFLKSAFNINWWKYDQEFLGKTFNSGKMRTIISFQTALEKVRKSNPELYIENCLSGGRMINTFTNAIAQAHWIRDGKLNGMVHAKTNILEITGAAKILPIQKLHRWTNRINEINDLDILKYYCRSAMIGVWGISADLDKINPAQYKIIKKQIDIYRQMDEVKRNNNYEMFFTKDSAAAIIIFYGSKYKSNFLMAFHWKKSGSVTTDVNLHGLKDDGVFTIQNLDDEKKIRKIKVVNGKPSNIKITIKNLSMIYKVGKTSD